MGVTLGPGHRPGVGIARTGPPTSPAWLPARPPSFDRSAPVDRGRRSSRPASARSSSGRSAALRRHRPCSPTACSRDARTPRPTRSTDRPRTGPRGAARPNGKSHPGQRRPLAPGPHEGHRPTGYADHSAGVAAPAAGCPSVPWRRGAPLARTSPVPSRAPTWRWYGHQRGAGSNRDPACQALFHGVDVLHRRATPLRNLSHGIDVLHRRVTPLRNLSHGIEVLHRRSPRCGTSPHGVEVLRWRVSLLPRRRNGRRRCPARWVRRSGGGARQRRSSRRRPSPSRGRHRPAHR